MFELIPNSTRYCIRQHYSPYNQNKQQIDYIPGHLSRLIE